MRQERIKGAAIFFLDSPLKFSGADTEMLSGSATAIGEQKSQETILMWYSASSYQSLLQNLFAKCNRITVIIVFYHLFYVGGRD